MYWKKKKKFSTTVNMGYKIKKDVFYVYGCEKKFKSMQWNRIKERNMEWNNKTSNYLDNECYIIYGKKRNQEKKKKNATSYCTAYAKQQLGGPCLGRLESFELHVSQLLTFFFFL